MQDNVLGFLRQARAELLELKDSGQNSRELSIVLTHVDTAILWKQEDIRLKASVISESN